MKYSPSTAPLHPYERRCCVCVGTGGSIVSGNISTDFSAALGRLIGRVLSLYFPLYPVPSVSLSCCWTRPGYIYVVHIAFVSVGVWDAAHWRRQHGGYWCFERRQWQQREQHQQRQRARGRQYGKDGQDKEVSIA